MVTLWSAVNSINQSRDRIVMIQLILLQVEVRVLDKNDSPPSFDHTPLHYYVSEDLGPGQSFGTVKAYDPDSIGELEYQILSGGDGKFSLDRRTGVLKLMDSLDRESKDLYKLNVRCSDGIQESDTIITVEVSGVNAFSFFTCI